MLDSSNFATKKLTELLNVNQLTQLIVKPTRVTQTTSTLLDVCVASMPEKIIYSDVFPIGVSDHIPIFVVRKSSASTKKVGTHQTVEIRNFKYFNPSTFQEDLLSQPWDLLDNEVDIDSKWCLWKTLFLNVLDAHAPIRMKRIRTRRNIPWLNKNSRNLIFERDKLKLKAIKYKSIQDWDAYKTARNIVSYTLQNDKKLYYRNLLLKHKHNPKESWQTINQILGRSQNKSNTITSLKIGENVISHSNTIAETFNEYFSTVGEKIANSGDSGNIHFSSFIRKPPTNFEFNTVSVDKVLHSFLTLSSSKATGIDKIPIKILKLSANIIAPSMTKLFNYSILNGVFPHDWKIAKVIALYKKGLKTMLDNYRPISILPAVSKAFENILYDQLYSYLSNSGILSKYQFGFRRHHSTSTALLDSTNQWYSNMDKGLINIVAFLDLKKAFDTIDHEILFKKLQMYGVEQRSLKLLESYLSNRSQTCFINGSFSTCKSVRCGIPQGSILGPLSFLVYINDLPNCLSYCTPRMFADDTTLTVCGKSSQDLSLAMNHDLNKVNDWLMANKLSLNLSKTEYMLIGSRHNINNLTEKPCISVGGKHLKQVILTESLGVYVDQFLSWDFHIENMLKKISSGIGAISRLKPLVCRDTLKSAYNSLVQTYFDYCCEVWDPLAIYYQINCRVYKIGQQELLWAIQTSTVNRMLLWQSSGGKL